MRRTTALQMTAIQRILIILEFICAQSFHVPSTNLVAFFIVIKNRELLFLEALLSPTYQSGVCFDVRKVEMAIINSYSAGPPINKPV
jgi:hypothetical protein